MFEKIIVVEDSRLVRRQTCDILRSVGYETIEADCAEVILGRPDISDTGEVALDGLIKEEGVVMVIMDIGLPGIDGITATQMLKSNENFKHIPVIIMSVDRRDVTVLESIKAGAVDYVLKPLRPESFIKRVNRVLGRGEFNTYREGVETIIWNFQDFLIKEIKRAHRTADPLSLMMFGMDIYTEIDDELDEEQERESYLDQLQGKIREVLRDIDTVVRYGVNEFILVLPLTDKRGREVVRSKVIRGIREFGLEKGMPHIEIQAVQYGHSTYPEEARDRHTLIKKAQDKSRMELLVDEERYNETHKDRRRTEHKHGASPAEPGPLPTEGQENIEVKEGRGKECPVCGTAINLQDFPEKLPSPKQLETDFKPVDFCDEILFYEIMSCPNCYYAAPTAAFDHIYDKEKAVLNRSRSQLSQNIDRNVLLGKRNRESVRQLFLLALKVNSLRQSPRIATAKLYHHLSWLFRGNDSQLETTYMKKALENYLHSYNSEDISDEPTGDVGVCYLIGELYRRLDMNKEAIKFFNRIVANKNSQAYPQILQLTRDQWHLAKSDQLAHDQLHLAKRDIEK
jgi:phosphoserine phosphatase RsbU/P